MKQQLLENEVKELNEILEHKIDTINSLHDRLEALEDENDRYRLRSAQLREHNLELVNEIEALNDRLDQDAEIMSLEDDDEEVRALLDEYSMYDHMMEKE